MSLANSMCGVSALAFFVTMGFLMVVLACALPEYGNWYPLFVLFTYFLTPLPAALARRSDSGISFGSSDSGVHWDVALFATAAFVVSGFGIPLVLWHHGTEGFYATTICPDTSLRNFSLALIFLSTLAYFKYYTDDDGSWSALM